MDNSKYFSEQLIVYVAFLFLPLLIVVVQSIRYGLHVQKYGNSAKVNGCNAQNVSVQSVLSAPVLVQSTGSIASSTSGQTLSANLGAPGASNQTPLANSSAPGTSSNVIFGNMPQTQIDNEDDASTLQVKYDQIVLLRNSQTELFKSFVVIPLESFFYICFMIGAIFCMGQFFVTYYDDPIVGIMYLAESVQKHWIAVICFFALFMHRVVLKKIENIIQIKDWLKFKENKS